MADEWDGVDRRMKEARERIAFAWGWIKRLDPGHRSMQNISILHAVEGLADAVDVLAKRNDPLAAEKAEAESYRRMYEEPPKERDHSEEPSPLKACGLISHALADIAQAVTTLQYAREAWPDEFDGIGRMMTRLNELILDIEPIHERTRRVVYDEPQAD